LSNTADPECCAVRGEVDASRSGHVDLCDARLIGGGKHFDAIDRAIGEEDPLGRRIVGEVTMVRLTGWIVERSRGVRADISGAREGERNGGLNREREGRRV